MRRCPGSAGKNVPPYPHDDHRRVIHKLRCESSAPPPRMKLSSFLCPLVMGAVSRAGREIRSRSVPVKDGNRSSCSEPSSDGEDRLRAWRTGSKGGLATVRWTGRVLTTEIPTKEKCARLRSRYQDHQATGFMTLEDLGSKSRFWRRPVIWRKPSWRSWRCERNTWKS